MIGTNGPTIDRRWSQMLCVRMVQDRPCAVADDPIENCGFSQMGGNVRQKLTAACHSRAEKLEGVFSVRSTQDSPLKAMVKKKL